MPSTSAEIVEAPGERLPFKVVFRRGDKVIDERPVGSYESGRRLIDYVLPVLQKHEDEQEQITRGKPSD